MRNYSSPMQKNPEGRKRHFTFTLPSRRWIIALFSLHLGCAYWLLSQSTVRKLEAKKE